MHARKQAILTRSDPIPSLRPGIDTSKRKKWQRSIRQPAQQPASQPQRSRNAHQAENLGRAQVGVHSAKSDWSRRILDFAYMDYDDQAAHHE